MRAVRTSQPSNANKKKTQQYLPLNKAQGVQVRMFDVFNCFDIITERS